MAGWAALLGPIVGSAAGSIVGGLFGQGAAKDAKKTAKVQRQMMRQQMAQADDTFSHWQNTGKRVEGALAEDAMQAGGLEDQDRQSAAAAHAIARAFKGGDDALLRTDRTSPNNRSAGITRQGRRDVAMGAASNAGRLQAIDSGRALRMGVSQATRGLPATAMSGVNSAANINEGVYGMQMDRAANIAAGIAPFATGVGEAISKVITGDLSLPKVQTSSTTPTPSPYYSDVKTQASMGSPAGFGWYGYNKGGVVRKKNGEIEGPGTGTSDSVPAMIDGVEPIRVSDGEMVMNHEAVQMFGPELERMNKAGIQRRRGYANGGQITAYHDDGTPFKTTEDVYDWSTTPPEEDGIAEAPNFGQAFGIARKAGLKDFLWKGGHYNTQLAQEPPPPAAPEGMSFRQAFRLARQQGLKSFTWKGALYNTRLKQGPAKGYADGGVVVSEGRGHAWWRNGTKGVRGVRNLRQRDWGGQGAPAEGISRGGGNYAPVEVRDFVNDWVDGRPILDREAANVEVQKFRPGRDGGGVPLEGEHIPRPAGGGGVERGGRSAGVYGEGRGTSLGIGRPGLGSGKTPHAFWKPRPGAPVEDRSIPMTLDDADRLYAERENHGVMRARGAGREGGRLPPSYVMPPSPAFSISAPYGVWTNESGEPEVLHGADWAHEFDDKGNLSNSLYGIDARSKYGRE